MYIYIAYYLISFPTILIRIDYRHFIFIYRRFPLLLIVLFIIVEISHVFHIKYKPDLPIGLC